MLTAIAPLGADAWNVVTDANSVCRTVAAGVGLGDATAIALGDTMAAVVGAGDVGGACDGAALHAANSAVAAIAPVKGSCQPRANGTCMIDPCLEYSCLRGCSIVDDDGARRAVPARLERRPAQRVPEWLESSAERREPQSASSRSAPASSRPSAVSAYSMRGGRSGTAVATTMPSRSSRRRRSVRMFGAMPARLAELVEPARAVEQRLDEQQAPAIARPDRGRPPGAWPAIGSGRHRRAW